MAFALSTNVARAGAGTTAGVDTTGANLLVAAVACTTADGTVSDSKSNTWNKLTTYTSGTRRLALWYSIASSVGSGHTFTIATASFPGFAVAAFSGGAAASVFDLESGASSGSSPVSPGTITPSQNDSLCISACLFDASNTVSVDGSFNITDQVNFGGGVNIGVGLAYLIQTTAAAANPAWTIATSSNRIANIASFKPAAAPAGGNRRRRVLICGAAV